MLKVPAEFPHAGSFALFVDADLPPSQQRAELVRIVRHCHGSTTALAAAGFTRSPPGMTAAIISFSLRQGASGTRMVELAELIDGTPLTKAEERELTDLEAHLRGRARLTAKLKAQKARAEALKGRLIFSQVMAAELRKLERLEAREQPSIGARMPREIAA